MISEPAVWTWDRRYCIPITPSLIVTDISSSYRLSWNHRVSWWDKFTLIHYKLLFIFIYNNENKRSVLSYIINKNCFLFVIFWFYVKLLNKLKYFIKILTKQIEKSVRETNFFQFLYFRTNFWIFNKFKFYLNTKISYWNNTLILILSTINPINFLLNLSNFKLKRFPFYRKRKKSKTEFLFNKK